MTPLTAAAALDQFYLDTRCRILDLAAAFDRLDRGAGDVSADPRLAKLRAAVELLLTPGPDRAERVQQIFSQAYDPTWPKPAPRFS
jgi:hypothetical protein